MSSLHRDPKLRASDADRDHVAEQLREHCATGRLTMDEFGERLERCYTAQTYGDLDALVEDLPSPNPYGDLPVPVSADHLSSRGAGGWLPHVAPGGQDGHGAWAAWGSASVVCWAIWLASVAAGGGVDGLWPVWVSVPWGGVLVAQELGWSGRRSLGHRRDRRCRPRPVDLSCPRSRGGGATARAGAEPPQTGQAAGAAAAGLERAGTLGDRPDFP